MTRNKRVQESQWPRYVAPARIARAVELRNLAVDLVALRGGMANAEDGSRTIQVMMFEGNRLSVLYKSPRVILSGGDAPPPFRPKGFMLEVWFDGRKDHVRALGPRWPRRSCSVQAGRMGGFDNKGAVRGRGVGHLSRPRSGLGRRSVRTCSRRAHNDPIRIGRRALSITCATGRQNGAVPPDRCRSSEILAPRSRPCHPGGPVGHRFAKPCRRTAG